MEPVWVLPERTRGAPLGKHFVDFQNDVTAADIGLAAREGYRSVEHLKRYTTTGMGTDQGKTANVNALAILGKQLQKDRQSRNAGEQTKASGVLGQLTELLDTESRALEGIRDGLTPKGDSKENETD